MHHKTAIAVAVAVAMLAGAPAWAQSDGGLQTVVVTSQKRKEDIRQVPLSVSVMTGDALAESHKIGRAHV